MQSGRTVENQSEDLFTFDFFGFGDNIWKILSVQYAVDQLRRFGKMKLKQDTEWDVGKVIKAPVINPVVHKNTLCFLFQVKIWNS